MRHQTKKLFNDIIEQRSNLNLNHESTYKTKLFLMYEYSYHVMCIKSTFNNNI